LNIDYIIAGQGLAGSILALELERLGADVILVDPGRENTCSRVAGGLITPITGIRLVVTAGYPEFFSYATGFYRRWEHVWHASFYHETEMVRLWKTPEEGRIWQKKKLNPEYNRLVLATDEEMNLCPQSFHRPHGGIAMQGARLDTRAFLDAARLHWEGTGKMIRDSVGPEDLAWQNGKLHWKDVTAKGVIFCTGAATAQLPWFQWAPWRNASGDILTLNVEKWTESRVINGGSWLLPLGGTRVLAGATHDDKNPSDEPRPEGRAELERRIRQFLQLPYSVTDHVSAIRPIFHGTRILMGRHPAHDGLLIFNGLASKGVLKAPWYATIFAEHLCEGKPLPAENDINGNW
jgi:glycine oxidase